MKMISFILAICLNCICVYAQDSTSRARTFTINGYIKDLQSLSFNKDFSQLISGNLIHNRLNFKWKPSATLAATAEFRTRLIWGEEVKQTPGFASFLKDKNERFNLQNVWIENQSLVLLTNTERLYAEYRKDKVNLRIGRQRINWGITTTWNPNDLFNSYNFLDFDYEERPGVDAARMSYAFNNSSIEFGHALVSGKSSVTALKYSVNKWKYDIQFLAGRYRDRFTLGAGWAGNILDGGFKGEGQYFFRRNGTPGRLNFSAETDYMFDTGWYINTAFLFNSRGTSRPLNNWNNLNLELSPENLMPTKWNIILTTAKEISPLFSANISALYSPGARLFIAYPTLQYNLATNINANLFWQSFFARQENNFGAIDHRCFLRIKANF